MTKTEYMDNLQKMVYDVNPAEIAGHIQTDTLRAWCFAWGSEMLNKIMMINLIKEVEHDD